MQTESKHGDQPILRIDRVTRRFGGVTAVRNASLCLQPGHVTSLIGPNGAGKTTLFNAVTGCIPASEGSILYHGKSGVREIRRLRPDQITALGIARTFQNIRLFSSLTVLENVQIGLHTRTHSFLLGPLIGTPRVRAEERHVVKAAIRYLEFCGLQGVENDVAGSLPYGNQRRLEIARALATGPKLLLLDEPAAGMNPAESRDLLELIRKIVRSGITVFLIEHDMRVVMNISDHIHVLDHGDIIAEGRPEEIRTNPKVIEAYLGKSSS